MPSATKEKDDEKVQEKSVQEMRKMFEREDKKPEAREKKMKNKDDSWIRKDLTELGCNKTQSKEGANKNDGDSEKDDRKRKHYDLVQSWDGGRAKTDIAEKDETFGKRLGKKWVKKERELETNYNGLSNKKPRTMRSLRNLNSDSNETPRGKPNLQEVIDDRLETEEYKRPIGTQ